MFGTAFTMADDEDDVKAAVQRHFQKTVDSGKKSTAITRRCGSHSQEAFLSLFVVGL
jgi:hypothetical protein